MTSPQNPKRAEILALLEGHTDRAEEARILALLRDTSPSELDALLLSLPLDRLFSAIDDRVIGPNNRAALLELLTEERLSDLSPQARAAVVSGLQKGSTNSAAEAAIEHIFLGTHGASLTALKNAIDDGDDYRDLLQLVFHDIDSSVIRDRILDHIAAEGAKAPRSDYKILSDIDDTLYRNWVDPRYPKGGDPKLYPGVRAFYDALDKAGSSPQGDLTFLTARPGDRIGIGEGITRKHLNHFGLAWAKILTGDFGSLITNEAMGKRKYESFVLYRRLFPEYSFVFCGDSGQGDAIGGGLMRAHPGGSMKAVFIHDVVETSPEKRAEWRAQGVYFHDTYIGAAAFAQTLGLIDLAALRGVAAQAVEDLAAYGLEGDLLAARRKDFQRDLDRVNALLPAEQRIAMSP